MPKDEFISSKECSEATIEAINITMKDINKWLENEKNHLNLESPKDTGLKQGERCDE